RAVDDGVISPAPTTLKSVLTDMSGRFFCLAKEHIYLVFLTFLLTSLLDDVRKTVIIGARCKMSQELYLQRN
ncbi:MAG: hypothetical protein V1782_13395, partial [Pseudomonadota bacterium]